MAEQIIGLEILAFLLGWFIRDLGSLGAGSTPRRRRGLDGSRRTAPKNSSRQPW